MSTYWRFKLAGNCKSKLILLSDAKERKSNEQIICCLIRTEIARNLLVNYIISEVR